MQNMRFVSLLGFAAVIALSAPAHAQSCKERFIKAATQGNGEGLLRQIVTQKIKGGQGDTVHEFIMKSHQHWLTKPIEPKGSGWTLLYDGAMYSSLDEGATWREITKFDEKAAEAARAQQQSDVEEATDVECGPDEVDGLPVERVHGQYKVTVGFKSTQIHTYWIDPESDIIIASEYETISPSFESTVSQRLIPVENAEVPIP